MKLGICENIANNLIEKTQGFKSFFQFLQKVSDQVFKITQP